jgi:8-hydroxy-5-deazaflavin:NADPH oxidoreductase
LEIGLIGAGHIGACLARKLSKAGHAVRIANSRGPETLADLAKEVGATAVLVADVAKQSDVLIISVPIKAIQQFPGNLFDGARHDLIVVDTGNYYSVRDGRIEPLESGMPETKWVAEQLGRPVVKAFNNISSDSLCNQGRPMGSPERFALPVAGDDQWAKDVVIGLIEEIGFDGVDAGDLGQSWRQQPGSATFCTDLGASRLKEVMRGLTVDDRAKLGERRDVALKKMSELPNGIDIGQGFKLPFAKDSVPLLRSLAGLPD